MSETKAVPGTFPECTCAHCEGIRAQRTPEATAVHRYADANPHWPLGERRTADGPLVDSTDDDDEVTRSALCPKCNAPMADHVVHAGTAGVGCPRSASASDDGLHTSACLEYAAKTRRSFCISDCADARRRRASDQSDCMCTKLYGDNGCPLHENTDRRFRDRISELERALAATGAELAALKYPGTAPATSNASTEPVEDDSLLAIWWLDQSVEEGAIGRVRMSKAARALAKLLASVRGTGSASTERWGGGTLAEAALEKAIAFAEEGWGYASDYFKEKWGYEETRRELRRVAGVTDDQPLPTDWAESFLERYEEGEATPCASSTQTSEAVAPAMSEAALLPPHASSVSTPGGGSEEPGTSTEATHSSSPDLDVTALSDWVHTARSWLAENGVEMTAERVTTLAHVLHQAAENGTP